MVKVKGIPKPVVRWFSENKQIELNSEIITEEVEENIFTLLIKKMKPKFMGSITCEAHNDLGVVTSTTILNFHGK